MSPYDWRCPTCEADRGHFCVRKGSKLPYTDGYIHAARIAKWRRINDPYAR